MSVPTFTWTYNRDTAGQFRYHTRLLLSPCIILEQSVNIEQDHALLNGYTRTHAIGARLINKISDRGYATDRDEHSL